MFMVLFSDNKVLSELIETWTNDKKANFKREDRNYGFERMSDSYIVVECGHIKWWKE